MYLINQLASLSQSKLLLAGTPKIFRINIFKSINLSAILTFHFQWARVFIIELLHTLVRFYVCFLWCFLHLMYYINLKSNYISINVFN